MNSIPMSVAGLKQQYEAYLKEEAHRRRELQQAKDCLKQRTDQRKDAYRKWQRAIVEEKKGLR